jgi:elongation factor 1 alpha-like protein
VAVNKMDVCDWSQERFNQVTEQLAAFLTKGGYESTDLLFVPVSGLGGLNLTTRLEKRLADWYSGPTLVEAIDSLPASKRPTNKPMRMVIADLYKTITLGPLTVSGKIEAGMVREGQEVVISPGNYVAKVKGIQLHQGNQVFPIQVALAGETVDVGLTNIDESMVGTSCILCDARNPMPVVRRFTAEVATLEGLSIPLLNGTKFDLHVQSYSVPATVAKLVSVEEGGDNPPKLNPRFIRKNQSAVIKITTQTPVSIEKYDDYRPLSRVLLRQNGVTVAAGRVTDLSK